MTQETTGTDYNQLTIRGGMLILTAVAGVLYLARHWSHVGGLWVAILSCALPFSWIVEFAFDERQTNQAQPLGN